MNGKICFLGAGNMGEAIMRGLVRAQIFQPQDILAADVNEQSLDRISDLGVLTFLDPVKALQYGPETLVLAVKPQTFEKLCEQIKPFLKPQQFLISIAAGVSVSKIRKMTLADMPIARVMPNTPALLGLGASAYALSENAASDQRQLTDRIFNALGDAVEVEEDQMNAVTALSGSGPAYIFMFMESLVKAGTQMGLNEITASRLAAQTIRGAAEMIQRSGESPAMLRQRVTSPGGTTEAALNSFLESGFEDMVLKALARARDKGVELGGE